MKKNYFIFLMIAVMASFSSCEEDDNSITPGGNGNNGNDNYSLSVQGEVKPITIQSGGNWYAETDDKWLQLSYMGGTGGETVDIIAAYNTSPEPRTGEIRIYTDISSKAFKSDTSSIEPSQTIKIEQPEDNETGFDRKEWGRTVAPHFIAGYKIRKVNQQSQGQGHQQVDYDHMISSGLFDHGDFCLFDLRG